MRPYVFVTLLGAAVALPQSDTSTAPTSLQDAVSKGWKAWPCFHMGSSPASSPASSSGSMTNNNVASKPATYSEEKETKPPTGTTSGGSNNGGSGGGSGSGGGGGSGFYTQSALYVVTTPTPTLIPTTHWEHDPTDVQHLLPTENNQVYYSTDGVSSPQVAHQMAWVSANYSSPAVMLDQSTLITYTYAPASNSLTVSFKTEIAFQEAKSQWNAGAGLIMTVNDDNCDTGAFCYLKAKNLVFNPSGMSCIIATVNIALQEAVVDMDVSWGKHRPNPRKNGNKETSPSNPSNPSDPSSNSTNPSGSSAPKNYTVGGDNNEDCVAPVDSKYGFPTACLGRYFDEDLDIEIGYQPVTKSSFAPFLAQFEDLHYPDPLPKSSATKSTVRKRWSLIPNFIKQALATVLPIEGVTTPYTKDISLLSIQMSVPQERTLVDSPWGQQVLIKSFSQTSTSDPDNQAKLDIYCVDCGMQGSADIDGTVGISILNGISSLGATLRADMSMTLKVGVDASIVYSQTFEQQLFQVPLSPLCIADIICVGPYLKLGAEVVLSANAQGQLLAGASITMHNAQASVDIVQFTASASGWQPEFNPVLQAWGSIDLSANVGLPLSIVLGINVLNGKFVREAALVDRPGLIAEAAVALSGGLNPDGTVTGGAEDTNGCVGIATSLSLQNEMYVAITGQDNIMLSNPPPLVLASGCIALPAASPTAGSKSRRGLSRIYPRQNSTVSSTTSASRSSTTSTIRPSTIATSVRNNTGVSYGPVTDNTANVLKTGKPSDTNYTLPDDFENSYNLSTGYRITTLTDTEKRYQVSPCVDGSVRLFHINDTVPDYHCSDMWTMTIADSVVMADGMARIPIYFPSQMSKLGVSRLRVVDVENVPITADEIVFVPGETVTDDGDTEQLYYPMNPNGDTYHLAVCKFSDKKSSTLFLMSDITAGLKMLQSNDLKYSVTGGDVKKCYYVPLVSGKA